MKNNTTRQRLYLAALLSGIGRFYESGSNDELLSKQEYGNVAWSYQFLKKYIGDNILQKLDMGNEDDRDSVYQFLLNSTKETSIIYKAEKWAVGKILNSDNSRKSLPLKSIFSIVGNNGNITYIHAEPLKIDDISNINTDNTAEGYKTQWEGFAKELKNLPCGNFEAFSESLLSLMKKYLWCIPVGTDKDSIFIDLYNYSKTKACIADCLFMTDDISNKLLLVGGDISGIQDYIYNIASRKAAVSLKGRSFYIQLLIDSIITRITKHDKIDSSYGHVLYSSGGKFYMLLPNTEDVTKTLDNLKDEIELSLWDEQKGQISFNLAYIPFNLSEIDFEAIEDYGNKIDGLWKELNECFARLKYNKFKSVFKDKNRFNELFIEQPVPADSKVCAVTGIEGDEKKNMVKIDKEDDSPWVLRFVKEQSDLGKTLKNADYIITHNGQAANLTCNGQKNNTTILDVANYTFNEKELFNRNADVFNIKASDTLYVKTFNDTDFLKTKLKGENVCYGFQFYGGNTQALNLKDDLKTFEELADDRYLGVLRMDVDNLGQMFMSGINAIDRSFSLNATLSFMLDYFFSGYLNTIRNKSRYKDYVNILYSGGDDVFAIGRWDLLIQFAEDIRNEFRNFTGQDNISISGGITIVGEKFPIAKAAQMAGDAESKAKKYRDPKVPHKNAFTMFGQTVSWKDLAPDFTDSSVEKLFEWVNENYNSDNAEFAFVKANKTILSKLIKANKLSKAILHKLMLWYGIRKEGQDNSYYWHTAYYLSRFVERLKNDDEVIKKYFRKDLVNILYKSKFESNENDVDYYRLMATAARWAELELRITN